MFVLFLHITHVLVNVSQSNTPSNMCSHQHTCLNLSSHQTQVDVAIAYPQVLMSTKSAHVSSCPPTSHVLVTALPPPHVHSTREPHIFQNARTHRLCGIPSGTQLSESHGTQVHRTQLSESHGTQVHRTQAHGHKLTMCMPHKLAISTTS